MTTRELSVAAAEDEVEYCRQAVDGCDRKLAKLRDQVDATKAARRVFADALKGAEDNVKAAKARDTEAAAGAAEGEGNA